MGTGPGSARLSFGRRADRGRTTLEGVFATSPLRVLTPRNHGDGAWAFLSSFGGGLLDGDHLDVRVDVAAGASAFLGTQASTKVYRARRTGEGASQRLHAEVGAGGLLAVVPDPVVCFADARYAQTVEVALAGDASLVLLDSYTCGRSARGERWAFASYASRTVVKRKGGGQLVVDAVRLDPRHGPLLDRMGRFDAVLSLLVLGPRCGAMRDAMLAAAPCATEGGEGAVLVAASPIAGAVGVDGCVLRVAAERFELASHVLRSSFAELARLLGDDPFARKW